MLRGMKNRTSGSARSFDYKLAFDYWNELGSAKKAVDALARDGYLNMMGEPYNYTSIVRAAWIWAIENPDEAFEYWTSLGQGYFRDGKDGEEWKSMIAHQIRKFSQSRRTLRKWLTINNLFEYYEQRYQEKSK